MKKAIIFISVCMLFVFSSLEVKSQLYVTSDGDVGIGTSSPSRKFHVQSSGTVETLVYSTDGTGIARVWTCNATGSYGFGMDNTMGYIYLNVNNPTAIMTFNASSYVGIGRTPSYLLDVNGSIRANTTIYSSDKRLKSNITSLSGQLDNLFKVNSYSYNLNSSDATLKSQKTDSTGSSTQTDNRIHYGFIAQEVQEIYPELVYEDNEGILGIDYVSFIPLLLEELKTQSNMIDSLSEELSLLKNNTVTSSSNTSGTTICELFQNVPNPFSSTTRINVY
jgi:hypothetical protein